MTIRAYAAHNASADLVPFEYTPGPLGPEEVEIAVENRGAGIPPEDVAQLFKRFARTAKARRSGAPGLGVGLYIAKELVEAHGGRIWVESTPGQTTTFRVALPSRAAEQKVA